MDNIFVRIEGIDGTVSRGPGNDKWIQATHVEFDISREVEFKDVTERLLPDHSHPDISKIVITVPSLKATYTPANLAETPTGSSYFGYNFQMSRLI
jgi:hypothetical protein